MYHLQCTIFLLKFIKLKQSDLKTLKPENLNPLKIS